MTKYALIFAALISVSLASGQVAQIDSNSITVTVYRNATLQPDQIIFNVDVSSDFNTSLDDVLAALAGTGVSLTNFLGVNAIGGVFFGAPPVPGGQNTAPTLDWEFSLPVPWSRMKDTMTALVALQKSISQKNSALTLSFGIYGTQVSPQLQQMQTCSASDLLSAARAQAQKLASGANLFVGAVLGMSTSTAIDTGFVSPIVYYPYQSNCSVTVKFAVTR